MIEAARVYMSSYVPTTGHVPGAVKLALRARVAEAVRAIESKIMSELARRAKREGERAFRRGGKGL